MKIGAALVFACLMQMPAYACKEATAPIGGPQLASALALKELLRPATHYSLSMADVDAPDKRFRLAGAPVYESAFARAIARAAKRSASELALEAATKIIVMCQKERNPALTTPFFRSDSQQAHCFRY